MDKSNGRTLNVPIARDEPDIFSISSQRLRLATPLGWASIWVAFGDGTGPGPAKAGLRGETTINRVDYKWSAEFEWNEDDLLIGPSELRRTDWLQRKRGDDYPTHAAYEAFRAELPALAAVVASWVADNPDEVYADYLHSLESSAYYLESEVNREADGLIEKLATLDKLHREIIRAEGQVKLTASNRSRVSTLAS